MLLAEPMMTYCQLQPWEQLSTKYKSGMQFPQESVLSNAVSRLLAIYFSLLHVSNPLTMLLQHAHVALVKTIYVWLKWLKKIAIKNNIIGWLVQLVANFHKLIWH